MWWLWFILYFIFVIPIAVFIGKFINKGDNNL